MNLNTVNKKLSETNRKRKAIIKDIDLYTKRLQTLNKAISKLNDIKFKILTSDLQISDHAVLRYQERVEFIPSSEIRDRLLNNKEFIELIRMLGPDGEYPINNKAVAVVRNKIIVTIKNT